MPHNWVTITIHKDRFDVKPACPHVRAGFDPLQVAIDWGDKGWTKVTVQDFEDCDGKPVETDPLVTTFEVKDGNVVKNIRFTKFVLKDDDCKYALHYTRKKSDGTYETLIVDPTVRLRPG